MKHPRSLRMKGGACASNGGDDPTTMEELAPLMAAARKGHQKTEIRRLFKIQARIKMKANKGNKGNTGGDTSGSVSFADSQDVAPMCLPKGDTPLIAAARRVDEAGRKELKQLLAAFSKVRLSPCGALCGTGIANADNQACPATLPGRACMPHGPMVVSFGYP